MDATDEESTPGSGPARSCGPWQEWLTPEGDRYYHNLVTTETTWEVPLCFLHSWDAADEHPSEPLQALSTSGTEVQLQPSADDVLEQTTQTAPPFASPSGDETWAQLPPDNVECSAIDDAGQAANVELQVHAPENEVQCSNLQQDAQMQPEQFESEVQESAEATVNSEDDHRDIEDALASFFSAVLASSEYHEKEVQLARSARLQHWKMRLARERKLLSERLEDLRSWQTSGCAEEVEAQTQTKASWSSCADMDFLKEECRDLDCKARDSESFLCAAADDQGVMLIRAKYSDLSDFGDPFALLEAQNENDSVTATSIVSATQEEGCLVAVAEQESNSVALWSADFEGDQVMQVKLLTKSAYGVSALASHANAGGATVVGACRDSVKVWKPERPRYPSSIAHPDCVLALRLPDPELLVSLKGADSDATKSCLMLWDLRQANRCACQLPALTANGGAMLFDAVASGPSRIMMAAMSRDGSLEAWDLRQSLRRLCSTAVAAPTSEFSLASLSLSSQGSSIALAYSSTDGRDVGSMMVGKVPELNWQVVADAMPAAHVLRWVPSSPSDVAVCDDAECLVVGEMSGKVSCLRKARTA